MTNNLNDQDLSKVSGGFNQYSQALSTVQFKIYLCCSDIMSDMDFSNADSNLMLCFLNLDDGNYKVGISPLESAISSIKKVYNRYQGKQSMLGGCISELESLLDKLKKL